MLMPWIVWWQLGNSAALSRELGRTSSIFAFADLRWSTLLLLLASSSLLAGGSYAMWHQEFEASARLGVMLSFMLGMPVLIPKLASRSLRRLSEGKP